MSTDARPGTSPEPRDTPGSRRLRWGVVGCGDIVHKRVARAISEHPDCHLLAACRRDTTALRDFCDKFEVERSYTDLSSMLGDASMDVVYVATPVALHAEQTIAALQHGKHVIVEKPMAMSTAECDAMIDAADRHQRHLSVAYYRRFYPHVRRIQQVLAEGGLGTLLSLHVQTGNALAFEPGRELAWRLDPAMGGGGPLMDIGSHRLDLLDAIAGPAQGVFALCSRQGVHDSVERTAGLLVRYAHGVHGMLQCYFGTAAVPDELTVVGTHGFVRAAPLNSGHLLWQVADRSWEETHAVADNLHAPLIDDMVRAIRQQRTPTVTGADGRRVNAVIEEAYRCELP